MAGNQDSGRVLAFKLSDKQLQNAIAKYKKDLAEEKFPRASWPHFCAQLGYTEAEVAEVIKRGIELRGAYYDRAVMLQRHLTWMRGELLSSSGWGGQNQTKAIYALKQDQGDGVRYTDGNSKPTGPNRIKIQFGGNDPRGKKASK